ncbi:hypothetical protein MHU86_24146 [Fragilaria crotonensis]|nr:hypothetical protein MHU86_24146 [Fragilaria crotonensis]
MTSFTERRQYSRPARIGVLVVPMKLQGDSAGSIVLKLCRLVLFAAVMICSIAVFRYESITLQVHTTVLKVSNATYPRRYNSLRVEHILADQHGKDVSGHDVESASTKSYNGIAIAGKQIQSDETERSPVEVTKGSAADVKKTQLNDTMPFEEAIHEVESALTASNDENEIAGKQKDTNHSERSPIEATKASAVDAERTQLNIAKVPEDAIPEVESASTASYNGSEIAVERIQTDAIERFPIAMVNESAVPADRMHLDDTRAEVTAKPETTRFVLFLCDLSFFNGAVALLASLAESRRSTSLPPLVMIMEDVPIKPYAQEILAALGAQVKMVDQPQELADAIRLRGSKVKKRWRGVFSKMHLFRRDVVDSDIVFYIDVDAVARGNVIDCMDDILQFFRSKPELDILAAGKRQYFNNGVMLARPRDSTFSYLVEMLRNGTCVGNCTDSDYTTMMKRRIDTDQDIFIEYTQRFPNRFEPIDKDSPLNVRPMHHRNDIHANCSVVHYAGDPKPWKAWFAIPILSIPVDNSILPMLPEHFPAPLLALMERKIKEGTPWTTPVWSLELWRDCWNQAVTRLQGQLEISSSPLDLLTYASRSSTG